VSKNDITGDKLISKASNDAFRANYDNIFKKQEQVTKEPNGIGQVTYWRLASAYRKLTEIFLGKNGK
jgi:hypothetical protein